MDGRRSSRRVQRLLVRIHSAENLRHVSSQGTYCKVSIDAEPLSMGSSRGSLKRLLQSSSSSNNHHHNQSPSHDSENHARHNELDPFLPRIYKTQVQKAMRNNPVWKEKFELPVFDAMTEVLNISIKSARLITAPSIGTCSIPLRDVPTETTADQWINLFDNSKRPAGRLRIQLRFVRPSSSSSRRGIERESSNSARLTMPLESPVIHQPPTKPTGSSRQSTPLSQSLMDGRGSTSTTTTSDSIVSDCSNGRLSAPVSNSSFGPDSTGPFSHSGRSPSSVMMGMRRTDTSGTQRDTALSTASRGTTSNDELDFLASKYMVRSAVNKPATPTVPEQEPVEHDIPTEPVPKDDRSPRTTNTTAGSSDEDEEMTVEFEFDTGEVRPSTRLPYHMMRMTSARSSMASLVHLESDNEFDEEDDESEPEDDEMDPDGDPDGPRMVLRNTVTKLLSRQSVNVIMDEEEEEEEDGDECFDPFVYEELPILDFSQWLRIEDIDCTDQRAAA